MFGRPILVELEGLVIKMHIFDPIPQFDAFHGCVRSMGPWPMAPSALHSSLLPSDTSTVRESTSSESSAAQRGRERAACTALRTCTSSTHKTSTRPTYTSITQSIHAGPHRTTHHAQRTPSPLSRRAPQLPTQLERERGKSRELMRSWAPYSCMQGRSSILTHAAGR